MRAASFTRGIAVVAAVLCAPLPASAQVTIEGGGRFDTLSAALTAAQPGQVLRIEGPQTGRFVIDSPLTLRGEPGAVLDGAGTGTVLTIAADGVQIEGLVITGSGLSGDFWQSWGAAGVLVEGDRAVLTGLQVSGNAWGVIFRNGQGSELRDSQVSDNQRDGILVQGGADHTIAGNTVARNRVGIFVDSFYGDTQRVLVPLFQDPAWNQQLALAQAGAAPALRHVIADNAVRGNGSVGIRVQFHTFGIRIEGNDVFATGIERAPDPVEAAFWAEALQLTRNSPLELAGAGIAIYCLPEETVIADNTVHDNRGAGIYLSLAPRNRVEHNLVQRNAIGIDVASAQDNDLRGNVVRDNRDYGIRLAGWMMMGQGRPDRNVIHLNDLAGNGVNAFDASDRLLTAAEIADDLALMPWPEDMRVVYDNPVYRLQMAQMLVGQQQVAHNRWDDGSFGNHHDDFDTPPEGFRDTDGDGIGEAGRAIPGGGAVDSFPLTSEALAAALR